MSAKALPLVLFPCFVLVMGILMNVSALAQTGAPTSSGKGTAVFCANPAQQNCVNAGSPGTSYYCNANNVLGYFQACKILPSCSTPPYPSPTFCIAGYDIAGITAAGCLFSWITSGSTASCGVWLPGGFGVFIPTAQIESSLTSQGAIFGFSGGGASGFIAIIGVAVGIISLLGLTIFGSGEQGEGLHILFQGGLIVGVWLVLSGLEGYPGASDAIFTSMNSAIAGVGTFLYAMLTLMVVFGFMGLVSRGA